MSIRYAPSPTGSLHLGNLRTAWISFQIAKQLQQPWHVRFEDIDTPRVIPQAQQEQLRDLESLGLVPQELSVQSLHRPRHWSCFLRAASESLIYPCFCSRAEVQGEMKSLASAPHHQMAIYSGHCRKLQSVPSAYSHRDIAWRFKHTGDESGLSDFIVARTKPIRSFSEQADESTFVPSYHWACAIDDHDAQFNWIVRAIDLKQALAPQMLIHQLLQGWELKKWSYPNIFHTALVTQDDGKRLEKRTKGVTLRELMGKGIPAKKIIECFEKNFSISSYKFIKSEDEQISTIKVSTILGL